MQKITFSVCLVSLLFTASTANAQNKQYGDEYESGYRGKYIAGLTVPDSALNFLVIGDWGRCGEYYQTEVAEQLARASVSSDASFIISTGDNFYPKGVASDSDPLWQKSYENVYTQFALQKDWYVVLGNHDYKTNPQAEIDYSKKSARWHMPSNYFSFKTAIDDDTTKKVLFVFIDSNPMIEKYHSEDDYKKQVKAQDTLAQRRWIEKTLGDPDPNIRWRIVVGHHPLYTSGKRIKSSETMQFRKSMKGILDKYKVDAYICGHEHQLEYLKPEGRTYHFISGSGSEARPVKGNLPESKFKAAEHGFMLFSVTKRRLKVQVINWEGKILYDQLLDHL